MSHDRQNDLVDRAYEVGVAAAVVPAASEEPPDRRTLIRTFGIIQIVDIALRAMSPAVNDPSTAISCVDQLSRIMILWTSRAPPPSQYYAPSHVLRVIVPWMSFDGLLDTAFEQIRHYAAADAAVSLRLMRAFIDIASTTQESALRAKLADRAERVVAGCTECLPKEELGKFRQRLAASPWSDQSR